MHIDPLPAQQLQQAAASARAAARALAHSPAEQRNTALYAMAGALRDAAPLILAANTTDLAAFSGTAAFRDRLVLTGPRIEAMAKGLEGVAALPDPLGRMLADWTRPNGLRIQRVATPIGVVGMIYESRPNVGADAAGLCLKSGNAVILRGGSDSAHSARAINTALVAGLRAAGLPDACVQIAPTTDRAYVAAMLGAAGLIDLIIPRGENRWSSGCSTRRGCRYWRMPRGFATPMCTRPPIRRWRARSWRTRRCGAPGFVAPPKRC